MAAAVPERQIASTAEHNGAAAPVSAAAPVEWGNSAPLALFAFAVTTFMLSMVNADLITAAVEPAVFAVALMFGGATQLIAGIIQLRTGNTFSGVLFSGFGAFWLSAFAVTKWYLPAIAEAHHGQTLGLFLYAFAFFVVAMTVASFRTNVIVVAAMLSLIVAFYALAAGAYGGHSDLTHIGGYAGLVAAALALYLGTAETCEASYGRAILPVWPLKR